MKQLTSPRRALKVAGATVAGAALALAMASPASACHTYVNGHAGCAQDGKVDITWTVQNSENRGDAKVTGVVLTPEGTTLDTIVVGATLPHGTDGKLTGHQIVSADQAKDATLRVTVRWDLGDGAHAEFTSQAEHPSFETECGEQGGGGPSTPPSAPPSEQPSEQPSIPPSEQPSTPPSEHPSTPPAGQGLPNPAAVLTATCNGTTVMLANAEDATGNATFDVTGTAGYHEQVVVEPGTSRTADLPAAQTQHLTVTVGGMVIAKADYVKPANCGGQGGGLPVTGFSGGVAGGIAALLLAVGTGLLLYFRRRRVNFVS